MARFCPQCGSPVEESDKFCRVCGARLESSPQFKSKEEKSPIGVQSQMQQNKMSDPIGSIMITIISILFVILVLYTLACAFGIAEHEKDQACGQVYQLFNGALSESGTTVTGGTIYGTQNSCSPGYCLSNGHCCPSNYRYYCEGKCYASSSDAMSASQGRCSSFKIIC